MTQVKNRWLSVAIAALCAIGLALALTACGGNQNASNEKSDSGQTSSTTASSGPIKIAVPSDATNEGRALLLLQDQGLIRLKPDAGLAATVNDIVDNPNNIQFIETEAAAIPATLQDVDFAIINGNYAIGANIDPSTALVSEDPASDAAQIYTNVVAVNRAEINTPKIDALVAALESQTVKDYIDSTYNGSVVTVFEPVDSSKIPEPEDDNVIKVGATPAPHAEILAQIQPLLAEKGWELQIQEFSDYIQPNVALANGELDANYFQHIAYLDDYNAENGTTLQNAAGIHFEPLGLYAGKSSTLEGLTVVN